MDLIRAQYDSCEAFDKGQALGLLQKSAKFKMSFDNKDKKLLYDYLNKKDSII